MVSLCIGLRYQVSVEVEVDDDVLAGVGVNPGEGELVRMTSFFLFGVAGLHLGGREFKENIYEQKFESENWSFKIDMYLSFRSSMINSWADQLVLLKSQS